MTTKSFARLANGKNGARTGVILHPKREIMPRIMHRNLRFQIIDKCLRDTSRKYRMSDLVELCNKAMLKNYGVSISRRSVQYDVSILQKAPFSIELDEELLKQGFYRYADTDCAQPMFFLIDDQDLRLPMEGDAAAMATCVLRFSSLVQARLVSAILSFGDDMEVVEPRWLRDKLAAQVATMNERYSKEGS